MLQSRVQLALWYLPEGLSAPICAYKPKSRSHAIPTKGIIVPIFLMIAGTKGEGGSASGQAEACGQQQTHLCRQSQAPD